MNIRAFARCAYGLGASAAILAGASASAMAGAATPITYYISDAILGLTFAGTITTDGTIGVLAKKNILNWSVTVSEFGGGGYTFSKSSGGTLSVAGRDLTASATSISFNFGDNNPATAGSFLFSDSTHSAFAGSSEFVFCSTYSYCGGTGQEGEISKEHTSPSHIRPPPRSLHTDTSGCGHSHGRSHGRSQGRSHSPSRYSSLQRSRARGAEPRGPATSVRIAPRGWAIEMPPQIV